MAFNPSEEIDNAQALQIIRRIVTQGEIILSNHAKQRMRERRYTTHDIEHILLHGEITKKELNPHTQTWGYTIKGNDLEGDEGGVVTTIIRQCCAVIITVLS